jgi:hypothetical protein
MPAHRVVANLGELEDLEIENIRLALEASTKGKTLVLPEGATVEDGAAERPLRVLVNLDYLHVAVALRMWEYWKLGELFNRLLPKGRDAVAAGDVVAALAIRRSVSPSSKLSAPHWFAGTALPELLAVKVDHFTEARVRRVLERLNTAEFDLRTLLLERAMKRERAIVADAIEHASRSPSAERNEVPETLAFLIERTLEQKLRRASRLMTAAVCFDELSSCHLNLLSAGADVPPRYVLSEPTDEQRDLIKVLRMGDLLDGDAVAGSVRHQIGEVRQGVCLLGPSVPIDSPCRLLPVHPDDGRATLAVGIARLEQ